MTVALRGPATSPCGSDGVGAPAGTIVFVRPGTKRGAIAAENDTAVLAVGAKPGVVFEPSPWEAVFAAYSYAEAGDLARSRKVFGEAIEQHPDAWQGYYNLACMEARFGDRDSALEQLAHAFELDADAARTAAEKDSDLDSIRDDARFPT